MKTIKILALITLMFIVSLVFIYSLSKNFTYFVDSKTYLSRSVYEYFITESTYLHPFSTAMLALLNCYIILRIARSAPILAFVFFTSPYQLLLLTNLTKEALFFAAIAGFTSLSISEGKYNKIKLLPLLAFISRPIYFLFYYMTPRGLPVLFIAIVFLYIFIPELLEKFISEFYRRTEGRDLVTHNQGREFFTYYCTPEKANIVDMITCLIPGLFFFPNQSTYGFIEYLVFLTFHVCFWLVLYKLWMKKLFFLSFMFISGYFLIFLMAPTFGAFIRYFYPQIWLFGARAYIIPRK